MIHWWIHTSSQITRHAVVPCFATILDGELAAIMCVVAPCGSRGCLCVPGWPDRMQALYVYAHISRWARGLCCAAASRLRMRPCIYAAGTYSNLKQSTLNFYADVTGIRIVLCGLRFESELRPDTGATTADTARRSSPGERGCDSWNFSYCA